MSPIPAPRWTRAELDVERAAARELFRKARIEEPAEIYSDEYEARYQAIAELLEASVDLADLRAALPDIVANPNLFRTLRYIAGPPISEDDLKTVAEVELSQKYLAAHPEAYEAIADSILLILDRKRFPWAAEGREPSAEEKTIAVIATAATDAHQRVQTIRRNQARKLEATVDDALRRAGFVLVAKRKVDTASDWPRPGEFCGEGKVAGRQADLIATLFDGRYLPIECKVSGSALNSIKRLNNDSLAKFATWTAFFGVGQTIPAAVLEGVYALDRLVAAQEAGAALFWSHRLDALTGFAEATKRP